MSKELSLAVNVVLYREEGVCVAHCLELDLVATGPDFETAQNDLADIIAAQIAYALDNDNLDHLYKSAPREVWERFKACRESEPRRIVPRNTPHPAFDISANTCLSEARHV